jgi:tetratricopeptide (TPR) repeat protein
MRAWTIPETEVTTSRHIRFHPAAVAAVVLCCTVAWQCLGPRQAAAQNTRITPNRADRYEITAQLAEALRYLSSDPQRSLGILRALDRKFPNNERVVYRIGYAYQVIGNTDSAEVYYRRALNIEPRSIEAGKALGAIYLSEDRRDDAMAAFDRLLSANGYNVNAYKAVGNALLDAGRYQEALDIYAEGRGRSPHHFVLTLDIAELHRSAREYGSALREYLYYADGRPGNYRVARERIMDLMREVDKGERAAMIEALDERLQAGTGSRFVTLDVLAAANLEQGLLEPALDMAIRADGEKESDGTVLLTLADQVIVAAQARPRNDRRRYLDLGVRALEAFSRNHSKAPGTDRAKYMLATIYVQFGTEPGVAADESRTWIEKAVSEYDEIARRYGNSEYAERANLERGDLLLHKLKEPRRALEAYKVGAVNSRRFGDVFAARIADLYLGTAQYADAEQYVTGLKRSGIYELQQTGWYYTGMLLAFRGEFDAARDTLTALAETDPASPYANDAIENAWIIQEALQYGSESLPVFMSARQAEMVGDTTTAIAKLRTIAEGPIQDALRPRALYALGQILFESGDLDGSLARYQQFLKEYTQDPLRPEVQRSIARLYEQGYSEYEKALREYEVVLMLYPDYAFLDEVREDVRRLKFIVEGEE